MNVRNVASLCFVVGVTALYDAQILEVRMRKPFGAGVGMCLQLVMFASCISLPRYQCAVNMVDMTDLCGIHTDALWFGIWWSSLPN